MNPCGNVQPSACRRMRLPTTTPFFTYTLGSSLYIPLTCRCNSLTLPETRGPNFMLPRDVVASLLRVREMELLRQHRNQVMNDGHDNDSFWDKKMLDMLAEGSQKLPSLLDRNKVKEYPSQTVVDGNDVIVHPRISDLIKEVRDQMDDDDDDDKMTNDGTKITSVVIAGEGEPTLRLHDLLSLTEKLSSSSWFSKESSSSTPIRLTTNGLVPSSLQSSLLFKNDKDKNVPQLLQSHGVSHVSVALMSADPLQYEALMQPRTLMLVNEENNHDDTTAHSRVCQFIEQAAETKGMEVEVTAVDRPEVDKEQLESLVKSLSVSNPVRWRPYFA